MEVTETWMELINHLDEIGFEPKSEKYAEKLYKFSSGEFEVTFNNSQDVQKDIPALSFLVTIPEYLGSGPINFLQSV